MDRRDGELSAIRTSALAEHPQLANIAGSQAFADHVAQHHTRGPITRSGDLLLAFACAEGDPRALRIFEDRYRDDVKRAARRHRATGIDPADVYQEVARRAFGPTANALGDPRPGKIAEYSGQGDLRSWVRVVATRIALDLARARRSSERPTDDTAFARLADSEDGPELAYFKQRYRAELRAAIEDGAKRLSDEERTALREHYVDGLSIDEVASRHGVHRATAARRIARARDAMSRFVQAVLVERHGLSGLDLGSIMRLVRSQLSITMERLLG